MKRYGDNLPTKGDDEIEHDHDRMPQVIHGGCSVRFEMLDFILGGDIPKDRKPLKIFSLFKAERKEELGG